MKLLITLLLTMACVAASAQTALPDETLRFADFLFEQEDYGLAILEYQRFLHAAPEHECASYARLQLALARLEAGEEDRGLLQLEALSTQTNASRVAVVAASRLAGELYDRQRYADAYSVTARLDASTDAAGAGLFKGLCSLRLGRPDLARKAGETGAGEPTLSDSAAALRRAAQAYDELPRKSPTLAGTLSAALPGAGQLYVRRPHDAAWAFLLNAVFIGAGAYALQHDEPVAGGFALAVETVWYSGNVYNAVNGAYKFNADQENRLIESAERAILDDPRSPVFGVFFSRRF